MQETSNVVPIREMTDEQRAVAEYAQAAEVFLTEDLVGSGALSSIGTLFLAEFNRAALERLETEKRWLKDLRQFKGMYEPDVLMKIGKRSRHFVRRTRAKVRTANARMLDLVFPASKTKNWTIASSPKPDLMPDQRRAVLSDLARTLQRVPTREEIGKAIKDFSDQSAQSMDTEIHDQLVETNYKGTCKKVLNSGHLYGTGILKGPLVERRYRSTYQQQNGKWVLVTEGHIAPFLDHVPVWRFYPDMAATDLGTCRYVYERHLMSKHEMVELSRRKSFNATAIANHILANPEGLVNSRWIDQELKAMGDQIVVRTVGAGQYEVLERWGWVSAEQLRQAGVSVPANRLHEVFFSNIWLLPSGEVIKAVIQPINGITWPYHLYYFDKDETSIFGEGIPSVMRDDQTALNAATRLTFDNAAHSAGPMFDVNFSLLDDSERGDEFFPWKIVARNGRGEDAKVPAVRVIEVPNHIGELATIADRADIDTDESTAIPRYQGGEGGASKGAAATMGGLSMLMGNANILMKEQATSWDENITVPFITGMFRWNMQFNQKPAIKGDHTVVVDGSASLVAKEVRGNQLLALAGQTNNPVDAQFIKRDVMWRRIAESIDLGDIVKTKAELDEEQNSPAAQMQMQLQQLQFQTVQAQLEKLKGEIANLQVKAVETAARAIVQRVAAVYSATQAGGVAATSPQIAPAADEILQSAGWQDMTPQDNLTTDMRGAQPGGQVPQGYPDGRPLGPQAGTRAGMEQGIETPAMDGGPNVEG